MSRDKQIEEMVFALSCSQHAFDRAWKECLHNNAPMPDREIVFYAKYLIEKEGYRKASEVALEAVDDFQRSIRHIFLDMCNGNDYNTLNLLQIDSAIEALFDCKIADLKK